MDHQPADAAEAVLRFWFEEVPADRWFEPGNALDDAIRDRFASLSEEVLLCNARGWRDEPRSLLAAVILLDQFRRSMYRGSRRAFAGDALARELTYAALQRGWERQLPPDQRTFLLMPLMHSETLTDQQRSVGEFARLGDEQSLRFAHLHRDQIARFGRFPGRNAALGRRSTPEEQAAIDAGLPF